MNAARQEAGSAASRAAAPRQGKPGMYRRKVAPGAQALKEAAQARYIADMRAHFEEVKVMMPSTQYFRGGRCRLEQEDAYVVMYSPGRIAVCSSLGGIYF